MPNVHVDRPHPARTARRQLEYVFTPKHHGGDAQASCWLERLSFDDEFAIFDRADGRTVSLDQDDEQVADSEGNLYGYEATPDGSLRELGTWHQQMAEFPVQRDGSPWHGYPIWPIDSSAAPTRFGGHRCRPHKSVFARMEELGHITPGQRNRLGRGDWI